MPGTGGGATEGKATGGGTGSDGTSTVAGAGGGDGEGTVTSGVGRLGTCGTEPVTGAAADVTACTAESTCSPTVPTTCDTVSSGKGELLGAWSTLRAALGRTGAGVD